jgi:hypothetical protein
MMIGIGDWCDPEMRSQIVCKDEEKGKSEGLVGRQLRGHNEGDLCPLNCQDPRLQAIVSIQSRNPISLGHGWIIEGRVDEILDVVIRRRLGHDCLADM